MQDPSWPMMVTFLVYKDCCRNGFETSSPKGKHRRRRTSGGALEGQLRLCSSSTQMMPNVVLVMSMSTSFIDISYNKLEGPLPNSKAFKQAHIEALQGGLATILSNYGGAKELDWNKRVNIVKGEGEVKFLERDSLACVSLLEQAICEQEEAVGSSLTRQPHNRLRHLQGSSWIRLPTMAPHGALGQEAKHSTQIGHQSLSLGLDARSLTVFELAGLHRSPERIGIFPHPLLPYPWDSSFSLSQWAPVEEAELIEEEQEVWGREIVATTWKRRT
uniref:Uncharacterized protein n=1 Tax=Quercus lobata TaxID=97700 RepID=A0A7N2RAQ7_QUELO